MSDWARIDTGSGLVTPKMFLSWMGATIVNILQYVSERSKTAFHSPWVRISFFSSALGTICLLSILVTCYTLLFWFFILPCRLFVSPIRWLFVHPFIAFLSLHVISLLRFPKTVLKRLWFCTFKFILSVFYA